MQGSQLGTCKSVVRVPSTPPLCIRGGLGLGAKNGANKVGTQHVYFIFFVALSRPGPGRWWRCMGKGRKPRPAVCKLRDRFVFSIVAWVSLGWSLCVCMRCGACGQICQDPTCLPPNKKVELSKYEKKGELSIGNLLKMFLKYHITTPTNPHFILYNP